jgi:hypothetical protein
MHRSFSVSHPAISFPQAYSVISVAQLSPSDSLAVRLQYLWQDPVVLYWKQSQPSPPYTFTPTPAMYTNSVRFAMYTAKLLMVISAHALEQFLKLHHTFWKLAGLFCSKADGSFNYTTKDTFLEFIWLMTHLPGNSVSKTLHLI